MTSVLLGMIKINEIEIRFFLIPLNRTHQHFFTDLLREKKEKIPGLFLILCMSVFFCTGRKYVGGKTAGNLYPTAKW